MDVYCVVLVKSGTCIGHGWNTQSLKQGGCWKLQNHPNSCFLGIMKTILKVFAPVNNDLQKELMHLAK